MRRPLDARGIVLALLGALVLGTAPAGLAETADEAQAPAQEKPSPRKREAPAVEARVKAGGDVAPVPGAPPAPASSTERKPMRGTTDPGPVRPVAADAAAGALVAVAFGEGEATLERDGVRQVVRPGSRLGADTVRSVAPDRIVLERPPAAGEGGSPALVIVTFDAAGRSRERVFWTADPTAPAAPEVKRP